MSADEPTYSVVRMAAGDGKGLPVLLLCVTDDDVAAAREQVRAGNLDHLAVIMIVVSFLHSLGVDPAAHDWSSAEYIGLLEMLGMPPFEWSPLDDTELTRLLAEAVSSHGQ
ncbi:hypothetical protein [Streptomyces sp. NBC_01264]|uniref:hypothetical protein n=1 Tax=Streptomyces sp. NBC_01264 TaxID=2903804 RepID=UPI00224F9EF5|nr:hypothetical protein [Streptomyces sp. NBC_01264]MCX4780121.1 hypothetical protein [Streptomyces sp. NBC_01264]